MKKEVTVWKVLFNGSEERLSSIGAHRINNVELIDKKFVLNYPVNKWVRPKLKESKLFCFKNKKCAIKFLNYRNDGRNPSKFKVCRAIAKNPIEMNIIFYCRPASFKKFWKYFSNNYINGCAICAVNGYLYLDKAPEGTMVCDALKCLE